MNPTLDIYNEDCLEGMKRIQDKSVDFILTDIPYELSLFGGITHGDFADRKLAIKGKDSPYYFISQGIDYDKTFSEFIRLLKVVNCCIFCSNKQVGKIMTWWEEKGYVATLLVWDKPNPIPFGNNGYLQNLEFIIYVREKGATFNNLEYQMKSKTFRYTPPLSKERIHETEKPVELLKHLLMIHSNENDVVLDPYAGSFSTAIACHDLKRNFIGFELDKGYYDKAQKRIREHQMQLRLDL